MSFCPSCGAEVKPGDLFCSKCGATVTTPPEEPAERAPEARAYRIEDRKYGISDRSHGELPPFGTKEASKIIDSLASSYNLELQTLEGKPKDELLYEMRHQLEETRVLQLSGLWESDKFSEREIEAVKEYVEEGGRLLVMRTDIMGSDASQIVEPFGLSFTDQRVKDELHHEGRHKDHAIISNLAEHPINKDIKSFCFGDRGSSTLEVTNPDAIVLASSSRDAEPPNAPVAVLVPYGTGWVLAIGGVTWFKDKYMKQFDNAQWFRNIYTFLFSAPPP